MSTQYEVRKSGLVAPLEPKQPEPRRGPLELRHKRDAAHAALQQLVHILGNRLAAPVDVREQQMLAVDYLAQLLLGADVCFEEKT
jgi:hypothetical protein